MRLALDLEPDNPNRMVQAAMVANLAGDERAAAEWIERAIAAGYNRAFAEREPDFQNLVQKKLLDPAPSAVQMKQASATR